MAIRCSSDITQEILLHDDKRRRTTAAQQVLPWTMWEGGGVAGEEDRVGAGRG